MLASYMGTAAVTTIFILKRETSAGPLASLEIGKLLGQAGIIMVGLIIFTILFNMLRSYRTCAVGKTNGGLNGFKLSMFVCVAGIGAFLLLNIPGAQNIVLALLPDTFKRFIDVAKAFVVAVVALLGYFIGRIFIAMC